MVLPVVLWWQAPPMDCTKYEVPYRYNRVCSIEMHLTGDAVTTLLYSSPKSDRKFVRDVDSIPRSGSLEVDSVLQNLGKAPETDVARLVNCAVSRRVPPPPRPQNCRVFAQQLAVLRHNTSRVSTQQ